MALVAFTAAELPGTMGRASRVTWAAMPVNDTGSPVPNASYSDRSVQVTGTFGGSTVTIQGSNDGGTTWATLNDSAGVALTFTSAGLREILQVTGLIRPIVTGGSGTPNIILLIIGKQ